MSDEWIKKLADSKKATAEAAERRRLALEAESKIYEASIDDFWRETRAAIKVVVESYNAAMGSDPKEQVLVTVDPGVYGFVEIRKTHYPAGSARAYIDRQSRQISINYAFTPGDRSGTHQEVSSTMVVVADNRLEIAGYSDFPNAFVSGLLQRL